MISAYLALDMKECKLSIILSIIKNVHCTSATTHFQSSSLIYHQFIHLVYQIMFKYLSLLYIFNIHQSFSTPYTQECSLSNPCNDTIQCPPSHSTQCDNEGYIVNCTGTSICESSTIICPESQSSKCSIICDGELSCSSIVIQSHSANLNITSSGPNALSNAEIDSISPSIITITHNGATNGLNDMNINTINDFDTINIQCKDIDSIRNNCWNPDTPPKLSYGQGYDQECTIISTTKCIPDDPLIANPEDEASVPEEKEPVTTTPSDRMTDSELVITSPRSSRSNQLYGMDSAVILIALGMLCGVLVSICICLLFCLHYHNKQEKMQLRIAQVNIASNMGHSSANNTSVSNILPPGDGPLSMSETELGSPTSPSKMGSIKSTLKKIKTSPSFVGKLSPSLKKLSPRLNPSKLDLRRSKPKLASTDSMVVQAAESIQPDSAIMIGLLHNVMFHSISKLKIMAYSKSLEFRTKFMMKHVT